MYDQAFFDAGMARRGTFCVKWDIPGMLPEDGVPMWVADMDFACAAPIRDAVIARAEHMCYGYPMNNPADDQAVCDYWRRHHALDFAPKQMTRMPCVVTGMRAAMRALTKPGDGVAIFTPVYPPFFSAIEMNGRRLVKLPLDRDADGRYRMNLDSLRQALEGGVRALLFCNPHNPLSRAWTREELKALVDLAAAYDAIIISDEIHADFVYAPNRHVPMLSVPGAKERTLMFLSASKTFNVAGLLQANAVSFNEAMLAAMQKELELSGAVSGNVFSTAATRAAYTLCDDWRAGMLDYLDGNRALLREQLNALLPDAALTPIEATYLAWIDLRAYCASSAEIDEKCRRHGLVLNRGDTFGAEGDGFMRLNFGCNRENLRRGVEKLTAAMKEE